MNNDKVKVLIKGTGKNIFSKFEVLMNINKQRNGYISCRYMRLQQNLELSSMDDYSFSLKATDMEDFMKLNGISEFEIDDNSIDYFFGYEIDEKEVLSTTLTKSFVDKFIYHDVRKLYIYLVNKQKSKGLDNEISLLNKIPLIKINSGKVICSQEVDPKHLEKLKTLFYKHNGNCNLAKNIEKFLNIQKFSKEEIEEQVNYLKDYQNKIQKIIDDNKEVIIAKLEGTVLCPDALDCGHLTILSNNPKVIDAFNIIEQAPKEFDYLKNEFSLGLNLNFPINSFSILFQRLLLTSISTKVKELLNDILYGIPRLS